MFRLYQRHHGGKPIRSIRVKACGLVATDDMQLSLYPDVSRRQRQELDGSMLPLSIAWEDGRVFEVDRVLDVCRAASLKAGGMDWRYTVRIQGKETYLF